MNDTWVTLQGWAGSDVERKEAGGVPLATFRIASTPRHRKDDEWVDGTTAWYTVNAWRTLARNVADSVHKGDPLVVHGRLRADVWERDGAPASVRHVVDAVTVGHDLSRGVAVFQRPDRADRTGQAGGAAEGSAGPDATGDVEKGGDSGDAGDAGADLVRDGGVVVPAQRSSPEAAA